MDAANRFPFRAAVALAVGLMAATGCQKRGPAAGGALVPSVQVVAVAAKRQPISETLSLVGTIAANEMVEIKSETDGVVQEINCQEGQPVKQGQLLVRLDETKLAAAVAEAEANNKLSRSNFERARQLYKDKLISEQEYDQAASTFAVNEATVHLRARELKDTLIYAPFSGIIGARNISPGQVITKSMTLTWLVDLDPVKVEISLPERFLSQLRIGQTIAIRVAAYPDRPFTGQVYFIAPQVDPVTRTALVKALIPNPNSELRPGMFANLDLTLRIRENAVVIPEVALSQVLDDNHANVYVVDDTQTVQLRNVVLGVRLKGRVEVLTGLAGGEKVIVEGVQKVGPGAKVRFAPAEASAPYEAEDNGV